MYMSVALGLLSRDTQNGCPYGEAVIFFSKLYPLAHRYVNVYASANGFVMFRFY